jgi:hypothetical protein
VLQFGGRADNATVPPPSGTFATVYTPLAFALTAASALAPVGVTVTATPAIAPPKLLVTVPVTVPTGRAHVTVKFTVSVVPEPRFTYDFAAGAVHRFGTFNTATDPLPAGTCETVYPPLVVVVSAASAAAPDGVTTTAACERPPPRELATVPAIMPVGAGPDDEELQPATMQASARTAGRVGIMAQ